MIVARLVAIAFVLGTVSAIPGPKEFRSIFYSELYEQALKTVPALQVQDGSDLAGTGDRAEVAKAKALDQLIILNWLPNGNLEEAFSRVSTDSLPDILAKQTKLSRGMRPSQLHAIGQSHPPDFIPGLADILLGRATAIPTLVVVPGLFSELIMGQAFDEILNAPSILNTWFKKAVKKAQSSPYSNERELAYDLAYSQEHAEIRNVSIDKVLTISSIDDDNGNPQVALVVLRSIFATWESFTAPRKLAPVYARRLQKAFSLVPSSLGSVYILGYSRGMATALEMASHAADYIEDGYPWAQSIKGAIALGGTHYGVASTVILDMWKLPKLPLLQRNTDMLRVISSLQLLQARVQVAGNTLGEESAKKVLDQGIDEIIKALPKPKGPIEWIIADGLLNVEYIDVLYFIGVALRNIRFYPGFVSNIKRLAYAIENLGEFLEGLDYYERILWWKNHEFPWDMNFLSIAAVQGDIPFGGKSWYLTNNSVAYDPRSPDYVAFRLQDYIVYETTGVEVNDGQQTLPFSPIYRTQKTPNSYFMGVLGTNHWGMALTVVFQSTDPDHGSSPFPRTALVKSIMAFATAIETGYYTD